MKRVVIVSLVLLTLGLVSHPSVLWAQSPQEIPFDSVPNFLKMPPGLYLGENAGVSLNSKGHIFVYSRTGAPGHIIARQAVRFLEFARGGGYRPLSCQKLYSMGWAHAVKV